MTDLKARLPRVGAVEADQRTSLLGALNGWQLADGVLRARLVAPPPGIRGWLACANNATIGFDRLDAQDCPGLGEDGVAAAELIDRFEPVLALIERAIGITLSPVAIEQASSSDGLAVELAVLDRHNLVRHRLWLIVPRGIDLLPAAGPFAAQLTAHVPIPVALHFPGPRLSPVDAAELAVGDLLLLGSGPFSATLAAEALPQINGRFEPAERIFLPFVQTREPLHG